MCTSALKRIVSLFLLELTPKPEKTVPAVKSQQTVKGTPLPAVVEEDKELGFEEDDAFNKKRNALKIAIPVLLSVAFILILSAAVVGLSACFCERNRRCGLFRMFVSRCRDVINDKRNIDLIIVAMLLIACSDLSTERIIHIPFVYSLFPKI